jgi:hypothetical protein
MGNKSLVSCERKRSYHFFHAEAAILFLMWKKKKKQFISLSFMVEPEKEIMDHLSSHSQGSNPCFSLIRENKSYVSSCGKQRQRRRRGNPSLSHCGKQSFVPCGSSSRRRNNHLSLSLMWKQKKKQQSSHLLSLSLSLSHV